MRRLIVPVLIFSAMLCACRSQKSVNTSSEMHAYYSAVSSATASAVFSDSILRKLNFRCDSLQIQLQNPEGTLTIKAIAPRLSAGELKQSRGESVSSTVDSVTLAAVTKTDERSSHSRGGSSRLSLLRLVIPLSGFILAIWFIIRRLGRWRNH